MTTEEERHRVVCAAFGMLRRNGEVLLGRRSAHLYAGDQWVLMPSGHMDAGESIVDALIREGREELGIDIDPRSVRLVHVMHHTENYERMSFFFEVTNWSGETTIAEPDKCSDLDWFPVSQLPSDLLESCRNALKATIKGDALSVHRIGAT